MRSAAKIIGAVVLAAVLTATSIFAADQKVARTLQDVSVTIRAPGGFGESQGSGVIFTRTNKTGEVINFVLTAAHVVANLRHETEVVSADGAKRTAITFDDAQVVKVLVENGRLVGRAEFDAHVLKYSDADFGDDIAILEVRKHNFTSASVHFASKDTIEIGTPLLHVGSLLGQFGANSMTAGIQSQVGRVLVNKEFDQSTCAAFPGSSGGGIYNETGQYVGMLTRGAGETFNFYVPIRRLAKWADKNNIKWLLDEAAPIPTDEERDNLPVEDRVFKGGDNKAAAPGKSYINTPTGKVEVHDWLVRATSPAAASDRSQ